MSDIDLKALREAAQDAASRNIWGCVSLSREDVFALLDRLESAERRAEEAEKERDAQKEISRGLVGYMGMIEGTLGVPSDYPLSDLLVHLDELRNDAERYRWLRTPPNNLRTEVYGAPALEGLLRRDVYLDASIDAAMAQEGGK